MVMRAGVDSPGKRGMWAVAFSVVSVPDPGRGLCILPGLRGDFLGVVWACPHVRVCACVLC